MANKKILCFTIGWSEVYLEQVLVDLNEIPIFFVCKDSKSNYYLVLAADLDEFLYWTVQIPLSELLDLLHGKLTMREAITNRTYYWEILTGQDIESDEITLKPMKSIDRSLLPNEGAFYKVLQEDVKKFVKRLEQEQR